MVGNGTTPSSPSQTASRARSTSPTRTAHSDRHADLLSDCGRIARVWRDRSRADAALWSALADQLDKTTTLADALTIYSTCAGERMRMATENARRLFDEYQTMMQKYSATTDGETRRERPVDRAAIGAIGTSD
jgi:hypothetical protein